MKKIENKMINKLYKDYLSHVSEKNKESYKIIKEQRKKTNGSGRQRGNIVF